MGSSWANKIAERARAGGPFGAEYAAKRARQIGSSALSLLFPARCTFCRADLVDRSAQPFACESCEGELVETNVPRCVRCGAKGADADAQACADCRRTKLWFDRVVTLGTYDGPLRSAILQTKTARVDLFAVTLASLLARHRRALLAAAEADAIVPIPMHWRRWLRRGTNGAAIIAARLSHELGLPLARDALSRRRSTRLQSGLLRTQRFENVRGAFRSTGRYHFRGANVLLVDDILTTGATASEAARILKRAGASRVVTVVLARTSGLD
ncbi:MAG: ComF family protein [Pirellulales bacterium]|nr:ComF family protein [Pirellulales bacterium]